MSREVPGDPADGRDAQGLRAPRLRPARRGAARRRPGGEGQPGREHHRLPLGLRHGRRAEGLPRRRRGRLRHHHGRRLHQVAAREQVRRPALPQEGQEVRQRPERLRRARLGLARHHERPRPGRAPARQADQPRRAQAGRVGHRQPLVRLAAAGDRRAAPVRVHREGQGALRPAVRARGRRRGSDAPGAEPVRTIRNGILGRNVAQAVQGRPGQEAPRRSAATR